MRRQTRLYYRGGKDSYLSTELKRYRDAQLKVPCVPYINRVRYSNTGPGLNPYIMKRDVTRKEIPYMGLIPFNWVPYCVEYGKIAVVVIIVIIPEHPFNSVLE